MPEEHLFEQTTRRTIIITDLFFFVETSRMVGVELASLPSEKDYRSQACGNYRRQACVRWLHRVFPWEREHGNAK